MNSSPGRGPGREHEHVHTRVHAECAGTNICAFQAVGPTRLCLHSSTGTRSNRFLRDLNSQRDDFIHL